MTAPVRPQGEAPRHPGAGPGRVVFTLAGERFALPIDAVEAVAPPPPLARVPHAAPALLGAAHLGGRIVPIVDLARLLGREGDAQSYDGGGEIVRLRVGGGSVGVWVDKIDRVIDADGAESAGQGLAQLIDPATLLAGWLDPPGLAAVAQMPIGEIAQGVADAPATASPAAFIVVEVGGKSVRLPRRAVEELVETVAWTPVPRAPPGFLGVGLLRGAALPVLSLAALLGLSGRDATPGGFVRIDVGGRRALLAVDRVVGLRFQSDGDADQPLDAAAAIPDRLRRIVLGFPPDGEMDRADNASAVGQSSAYLAFTVAGLDCAISAECVDRIVGPQSLIRLPRPSGLNGNGGALEGAIELHGQILPVAALRARLGLPEGAAEQPPPPQAYVVLRDAEGLGAIGVDQARQLVSLRPEDIAPSPADERTVIAGVAALDNGGLLRVIAADRLWRGA